MSKIKKALSKLVHSKRRRYVKMKITVADPPKKHCCICGCEIQGDSKNPHGAADDAGHLIKWKTGSRCCQSCYDNKVVPERTSLYQRSCSRHGGDM